MKLLFWKYGKTQKNENIIQCNYKQRKQKNYLNKNEQIKKEELLLMIRLKQDKIEENQLKRKKQTDRHSLQDYKKLRKKAKNIIISKIREVK